MKPVIKPTLKQHEVWQLLSHDNTEIRVVGFGGGAGGGKSWLGCEWLLTQCYFYPGSRWFIARNELKRLMLTTFRTWSKVCAHHGIPQGDWQLDGKHNVIRFKNGSTIDLLDVAYKPTDPEYQTFGSLEYTGGFFEEAGEIHFDAFDVLKSRVGRANIFDGKEITPKVLLTFNPARNWLYRIFYQPWKDGTLAPGYAFIQSLYKDNPHTAKSYGDQLKSLSNEANRARLMDGNWEYEDTLGLLFKYDHVMDMFTNVIENDGDKYLIVDVARFGKDSTRFSFWEGLHCYRREIRTKQDTAQTARDIRDFTIAEGIPYSRVLVDELNMGAGVVDQLPGVKSFNSSSSPLPTRTAIRKQISYQRDNQGQNIISQFSNLRSQCVFKLAELIEKHKISCTKANDADEIVEDITAHKQKDPEKDDRKLSVTPKDEIKENIGRSPDVGDTFIMRMWFELMADAANSSTLPQSPLSRIRPAIHTPHLTHTRGE
jgi:phage terminase large subunit